MNVQVARTVSKNIIEELVCLSLTVCGLSKAFHLISYDSPEKKFHFYCHFHFISNDIFLSIHRCHGEPVCVLDDSAINQDHLSYTCGSTRRSYLANVLQFNYSCFASE